MPRAAHEYAWHGAGVRRRALEHLPHGAVHRHRRPLVQRADVDPEAALRRDGAAQRAERVRAQSAVSFREQGYERGGDDTPPEVFRDLARLNEVYERKFGFRFVVFVNRRSKASLVPVLEERLERSRDEERATALQEILAIAADRLQQGAA